MCIDVSLALSLFLSFSLSLQCGNYTDAEVNAGTGAKCRAIQGEGICTYGIAFAAAEDEETISLVMKKKQTEHNAIPMTLVQ